MGYPTLEGGSHLFLGFFGLLNLMVMLLEHKTCYQIGWNAFKCHLHHICPLPLPLYTRNPYPPSRVRVLEGRGKGRPHLPRGYPWTTLVACLVFFSLLAIIICTSHVTLRTELSPSPLR